MVRILMIALLFLPLPALAAELPDFTAKYKIYWSGLNVGDLEVRVKTEKISYRAEADIDSRGFAWLVSKYWSKNRTEGKRGKNGLEASQYQTKFSLRKRLRTIDVFYKGGVIERDQADPPENRDKRPEVPLSDKKDAWDPLTVAMMARERAATAKPGDKFSYKIWDGRRLFTLDFKIGQEEKYSGNPAIPLIFVRKPIAGFTKNELEDMKGKEPEIKILLRKSDMIPVFASGKAPLGTATGKLVGEGK